MTTAVKRNKSLVADIGWVLKVADRLPNGTVELTIHDNETIQATLNHMGEGVALAARGRTATDAVHGLREQIEELLDKV